MVSWAKARSENFFLLYKCHLIKWFRSVSEVSQPWLRPPQLSEPRLLKKKKKKTHRDWLPDHLPFELFVNVRDLLEDVIWDCDREVNIWIGIVNILKCAVSGIFLLVFCVFFLYSNSSSIIVQQPCHTGQINSKNSYKCHIMSVNVP